MPVAGAHQDEVGEVQRRRPRARRSSDRTAASVANPRSPAVAERDETRRSRNSSACPVSSDADASRPRRSRRARRYRRRRSPPLRPDCGRRPSTAHAPVRTRVAASPGDARVFTAPSGWIAVLAVLLDQQVASPSRNGIAPATPSTRWRSSVASLDGMRWRLVAAVPHLVLRGRRRDRSPS